MADENYAIRVKFEGIEDSIAQIAKLQKFLNGKAQKPFTSFPLTVSSQ